MRAHGASEQVFGKPPYHCVDTVCFSGLRSLSGDARKGDAVHRLQTFVADFWNRRYCKAHKRWLLEYFQVLKILCDTGALPLDGNVRGISRWLRRQIAVARRLKLRFSRKASAGERRLSPFQVSLLRDLPKWQSTGRWQLPSSALRQAQAGRRSLQLERARLEAEDYRSLCTTWPTEGIPQLFASRFGLGQITPQQISQIASEVQLVQHAYPGSPPQPLRSVRCCGWTNKGRPISLLTLSQCAKVSTAKPTPSSRVAWSEHESANVLRKRRKLSFKAAPRCLASPASFVIDRPRQQIVQACSPFRHPGKWAESQ